MRKHKSSLIEYRKKMQHEVAYNYGIMLDRDFLVMNAESGRDFYLQVLREFSIYMNMEKFGIKKSDLE